MIVLEHYPYRYFFSFSSKYFACERAIFGFTQELPSGQQIREETQPSLPTPRRILPSTQVMPQHNIEGGGDALNNPGSHLLDDSGGADVQKQVSIPHLEILTPHCSEVSVPAVIEEADNEDLENEIDDSVSIRTETNVQNVQHVQNVQNFPMCAQPPISVESVASPKSTGEETRKRNLHVYDFDEEDDEENYNQCSKKKLKRHDGNNSEELKHNPRIHKRSQEGRVMYVPSGIRLQEFLDTEPLLRDINFNRGKRSIKRHLVLVTRWKDAVDTGSWQRGKHVNERNRVDDCFVLTEEGKRKQDFIQYAEQRDEYVVNWYMWCPGHGNCRRKCDGYGKCVEGQYI